MEKNGKGRLEVVEYRDSEADRTVRLFLLHRQDSPTEPVEANSLQFRRNGPIYQILFLADGREHCHEYPIDLVARTEENCRSTPAENCRGVGSTRAR